jgi:hypothetical protein
MELILFFIVGGIIIWALVWAASGRDKNNGDDKQ